MLVLDEPESNLDFRNQLIILDTIKNLYFAFFYAEIDIMQNLPLIVTKIAILYCKNHDQAPIPRWIW